MQELSQQPSLGALKSSPTGDFQEVPKAQARVPNSTPYIEPSRHSGPGGAVHLGNEALPSEIPTLLTNAEVLFRHQENELAFALLLQALRVDSHSAPALKKIASFHFSKKRFEQAEKSFEALLKSDYSFLNLVHLAESYYSQGKDQLALERYEEAILALVGDIESPQVLFDVYKNMGNIQCRTGDFHAAEESYFRAFSLNSKSDTLLVNLGTLDFQKGELSSSLDKFRQALSLNPNNDKAWVGLAIVHDKMGDFGLAVANIENAVDIAPQNRTAVHIMANWAVRDHRLEPAISALEEFLSRVEQDEEMSLVLIHLFCLTQQYRLAHFEIERVLLWNPTHPEVLKLSQELPREALKI